MNDVTITYSVEKLIDELKENDILGDIEMLGETKIAFSIK